VNFSPFVEVKIQMLPCENPIGRGHRLTNFDSLHFNVIQKTAVNTALASLELAVSLKLANLSAA
jgi:hypothetical protein